MRARTARRPVWRAWSSTPRGRSRCWRASTASDRSYWSEVWVSVPLVILIVLMGITGGYFAPRQERLAGLAEAGAGPEYTALAAQVARVAFVAAALVVVAIFFMVAKP